MKLTDKFQLGLIGSALTLTLISISFAPRVLAQDGEHAGDRAALIALYNATDGPNWKDNTNWATDVRLGKWHGVTTDGSGRVIRLALNYNQMSGEIPPELGSLSSLVSLSFHYNELSGEIPPELGNLSTIKWLNLNFNQLSGEIPSEFGNLLTLRFLTFSSNQLSGEIPPELSNLSELEKLWLYQNQLSGGIPAQLGNLSSLTSLSLNRNQLSGEIPPELGNLSSLTGLSLYKNQLSGEIPPELSNLSNLSSLNLGENRLSGDVLPMLLSFNDLWTVALYGNQFSGEIPPGLDNLSNLTSISLSNNQFSGEIPPELGNLSNLRDLYLHDNEFSGEIPLELGSLLNLIDLRLYNNHLSGCVPWLLGHNPNLNVFHEGLSTCPRIAVREGGRNLVQAPLLAVDTDVDSETLMVTGVGGGVNGRVSLDGGIISYEHDGSETTMGGFTYTISDGSAEATGEVVVDVAPVNDPPVAVADRIGVDEGGTVSLDASDLLANDTDVDSETLSITEVGHGENGVILLDGTTIVYEHDGSETTMGGFTYTISDGSAEATGAVKIDVMAVSGFPAMLVFGFLIGAVLVTIMALIYIRMRRSKGVS